MPLETPPKQNEAPQKPATPQPAKPAPKPDPTRYGDWEIGGRCVDF